MLILGEAVQVLLLKLLEGKEERSVINACHILKVKVVVLYVYIQDYSRTGFTIVLMLGVF